ncbi:trehalose operon repressor [Aneurinibacillus sp. Ricciae_BoGa-3]|uniref:trehalose operon repressor n=1 Tax=Aneurinibacillus sp. Ricciae_BoGa-3 TaxID=3022697 RepID=UPI002340C73F|nr:trehalose operon repressor [Aneurinibacillus sp. Ricciae_BoGa-3]WCK55254.1 trehalose operon repressor [Aneurinibacillus sp. Ricciae_BoGa-3]
MKNKYLAIYNQIVRQIQNGSIEPNTTLPSENDLGEHYGASRETIRKALLLLAQNGYIHKIKGKGSVVLDVSKLDFPISGLVSFKEIARKMGKPSKTLVPELTLIKPDKFLMNRLSVSRDDEVWKVVRVRVIEDERIILDKDFFNKQFVPTLTKEVCEDSIYEYLENEVGIVISFAKKEFVVEDATEEDRQYLDLGIYNMVVVVRNYVYLHDASLMQYTESRHRPDKFRFVDFARRN